MGKRRSTYVPTPELAPHIEERFNAILGALSGETTVTGGAQKVGLSRVRFETLMNRATAAMIEGLSPHAPGRPPTPEREATLAKEVEKLRRQNERLRNQVQTSKRMLEVVGQLMRGEVKLRDRTSSRKKSTASKDPPDPTQDEPDGRARARLQGAETMRQHGLTAELAANAVGASAPAVRRWKYRQSAGQSLRNGRGPRRTVGRLEAHEAALIEDRVRELHGLVGAASLSRTFPSASRRDCGAVKSWALRAMERDRIAATERITITVPGVLRGFDQLYVRTALGLWALLISADGAVSFRTSVSVAEHYDGPSVARAVEHDFAVNGAPLVWRADRARSHETAEVLEVLARYGVLLLHGPPRHPRFYGQLERQNREHRAFFEPGLPVDPASLEVACDQMLRALNTLWKRPTLGWRTAQEMWESRPTIDVDRDQLRDEVRDQAARIGRHLDCRHAPADLAERLAIEDVLSRKGYLKRQLGGWC
jgi:transposase InsO family protein